jgi:hypothetical protein
MKTIVRQGTDVSLYLFADTETVNIGTEKTTIGNPVRFIVGDCQSSNVILCESVTKPTGWVGGKYLYTTDDGWTLNPNWVDPDA